MKTKWMKKILAGALSAAMCCGMLTGCGKGVEQINEELNIYVSSEINETLQYPLRLYEQKYPDVKVNVKIISEDAEDIYYDKIKSSLMTGNDVPDLLIIDSVLTEHCDIYKTEQTGAFIDLNTMLSEDAQYDASKYNKAVLDGVTSNGNQYIYPIAYHLPYILSTKERLTALGITVEQFQSLTVLDFFQLLKEKQEEYGLKADELISGRLNSDKHGIKNMFTCWYCPNIIDYEKQNFSLDAQAIQALIENMDFLQQSTDDAWNWEQYMFSAISANEGMIQDYIRYETLPSDEEAVLTCLRDKNGKINAYVWFAAAIPLLSPNQQNAYNLLKILISEDVQNYKYDNETLAYDFTGVETQVMSGANHMWSYAYYSSEEYLPARNADFAYREEVSGSFLYNEWSKLIMEQAEEYYKGNCSAEQAVESVEKKLKIYVSE